MLREKKRKKDIPPLCKHSMNYVISGSQISGEKTKANTFYCSSCKGKFSNKISKWICPRCPAMQCIECKNPQPYASGHCLKGHNLNAQMSYLSRYQICNNCCKSFNGTSPHWICHECKFQLCNKCKKEDDLSVESSSLIQGLQAEGIEIRGQIIDTVCSFELELSYVNSTQYLIETKFCLPLDETLTVTGMTAVINGKELVAAIKPRNKAEIKYTDAISSGDNAYLMTLETNKVELKTGNILPGQLIKITMKMVTMLRLVDKYWTLVLPLKIIERGLPLSININVCSGSKIKDIMSNTHKIEKIFVNDYVAKVKLLQWEYKEFWIQFMTDQMNLPAVIVQQPKGQNESAALLSFVPTLKDGCRTPGEFIFMLDRSGSMSGKPLNMAKDACLMFLKSLPPKSAFNVYLFESSFVKFFDNSADYTKDNLNNALDKLKNTDSAGGTNLKSPMADLYSKNPRAGLKRFVFILTDGEVESKEEIITLIAKHSKTTAVFSIGIGSSADANLIHQTASVGGGSATFIEEGENMTPKIILALSKALKPSLGNIQVKWPGTTKVLHTSQCFNVTSGEKLSLVALCENLQDGQAIFSATDLSENKEIKFEFNILKEKRLEGNDLFLMAASLVAKNSQLTPEERLKFALKYSLLTEETSFILVEKQKSVATEELKTVSISKLSESSAEEIRNLNPENYGDRCVERCCCMPESRCCMALEDEYLLVEFAEEHFDMGGCSYGAYPKEEEKASKLVKPKLLGLEYIVLEQEIEGYWKSKAVCELLQMTEENFIKTCPSEFEKLDKDLKGQIWATLIALWILKLKHGNDSASWVLIADKAIFWITEKGFKYEAYESQAKVLIEKIP